MDYGIVKIYRLARKCYLKKVPVLPRILQLFMRIFFSCTIPYKCNIGYGTKLPHFGQGVLINELTNIGKNCIISGGVVIGGKHSLSGRTSPTIGNSVIIGANATIIGGINIGDGSIVGAGAVVVKDVEENTIVAGNPAKLIRRIENGKSKGNTCNL